MTIDEAKKVIEALEGALGAFEELSAEHNGKRAANWGKVNEGLITAERLLAKLKTATTNVTI